MNTLQRENIYEIAVNLDLQSLNALCTTNSFYRNICQDGYFWKLRTQRHYPDTVNLKPDNIPWRDFYLRSEIIQNLNVTIPCGSSLYKLANNIYENKMKAIEVYFNNKLMGKILISHGVCASEIHAKALKLLPSDIHLQKIRIQLLTDVPTIYSSPIFNDITSVMIHSDSI